MNNTDQFLLTSASAPYRIDKADGCCYRQGQNENEKKVIHSMIAYSKASGLYTSGNAYIKLCEVASLICPHL